MSCKSCKSVFKLMKLCLAEFLPTLTVIVNAQRFLWWTCFSNSVVKTFGDCSSFNKSGLRHFGSYMVSVLLHVHFLWLCLQSCTSRFFFEIRNFKIQNLPPTYSAYIYRIWGLPYYKFATQLDGIDAESRSSDFPIVASIRREVQVEEWWP